jgi:hypothetical protein
VRALSLQGREAYFTDDGFAIGIAYVLAILKQDKVRFGVSTVASRGVSE